MCFLELKHLDNFIQQLNSIWCFSTHGCTGVLILSHRAGRCYFRLQCSLWKFDTVWRYVWSRCCCTGGVYGCSTHENYYRALKQALGMDTVPAVYNRWTGLTGLDWWTSCTLGNISSNEEQVEWNGFFSHIRNGRLTWWLPWLVEGVNVIRAHWALRVVSTHRSWLQRTWEGRLAIRRASIRIVCGQVSIVLLFISPTAGEPVSVDTAVVNLSTRFVAGSGAFFHIYVEPVHYRCSPLMCQA